MAYTADMFSVRIDGSLAGSESWSNTWTARRSDGGADIQDFIDALHVMYTSIAASEWPDNAIATMASWRQLNGASFGTGVWSSIAGSAAGPLVPTECAIRVSLTADGGHRGGPFLPGFRAAVLDADGGVDVGTVDTIHDALSTFKDDALASSWVPSLDSPTDETVYTVAQGRIGRIFDVIRRRRNDLPESYVTVDFGP